jgi:hypothetical protein
VAGGGRRVAHEMSKCEVAARGRERREKMNHAASEFANIHRLIDEYRQTVPVSPATSLFIGKATSPTNISHVYSLVAWPHRRI